MNREIKFRGKSLRTHKWVYGYYLPWHAVKDLENNEPYAQIFEEHLEDGKYIPKGWEMVSYKTIGQYTGLKDKNGNEIYEGDILELEDRYCKVEWHPTCACWDLTFAKYKNSHSKYDRAVGRTIYWKYYEIVGNIYDNPELLE